MATKLPTEWEATEHLAGVEVKLDGDVLMFRLAGCERTHLIGWWVRPPGVRATCAVKVIGERGGSHKMGSARTLPEACRLIAKHLGRTS